MGRVGIWIANTCLFVLCCWLVAANLNQVASAMLAPAAVPQAVASARAPATRARTFEDRRVIITRDLFNVATLVPATETAEQQEELEETKLPLRLLGTAATSPPELSWAAVEDQSLRKEVVVTLGSELADSATVVAIERRRIILENRGHREELLLEEDDGSSRSPARARAPTRPAPRAASRRGDIASRVKRLAANRYQVSREDVVEMAGRSPAEIFSSARILPKYDDGQMVGIQLNNVKSGSLFEEIGIQDGDVITQFNGIEIDSPQGSAEVLRELTQADVFELQVTGADGGSRTLTYQVSE